MSIKSICIYYILFVFAIYPLLLLYVLILGYMYGDFQDQRDFLDYSYKTAKDITIQIPNKIVIFNF